MASSELKHKNQKFELFPLILNQLDELKVPLEKKNIRIIFDRKAMENLTVLVNQNLIEDSVLHHVLVHLAVYTSEKSAIEIFSIEKPQKYFLIFHSHHITGPEAFQTDRRFEVAKKVMNLCGGSLTLENSDSHGMLIKLEFPVTMKVDRSLEK